MWTYENRVRIRFGAGALDGIGDLVQDRAYCLVTYDEPIFHDLARRIAALAGRATLIIDNVIPNPDFHMLTESCAQFAAADRAFIRWLLTKRGEDLWWELNGTSVMPILTARPEHKFVSRGGSIGRASRDWSRLCGNAA